jgi:hypothetical protein
MPAPVAAIAVTLLNLLHQTIVLGVRHLASLSRSSWGSEGAIPRRMAP